MLKRLRADGFNLRYLCAGEHGERKGRAHWHIILFFQGIAPELPNERRIEWKYWPHGMVYSQMPDYGGFCYLLKYTLKDDNQRAFKKRLRLSKYPPIGALYFKHLAQRMADGGFAMHSPEYSFGHCRTRGSDGVERARRFWLWDRSRELFLAAYVEHFRRVHGREPPDTEFLQEAYYDRIAKGELAADPVDLEARIARRAAERLAAPRAPEVRTWAQLRGVLLLPGEGKRLVSRYSDGTARLVVDGKRYELGAGPGLGAALECCGIAPELRGEVVRWVRAMPADD